MRMAAQAILAASAIFFEFVDNLKEASAVMVGAFFVHWRIGLYRSVSTAFSINFSACARTGSSPTLRPKKSICDLRKKASWLNLP